MYQIIQGDCIEGMKTLPDESVHCVVTSPPYYGLRDYGTATWEGGDPHCTHTISMDTKWNDPKRGTDVLRPETSHRGGTASHCHLCGATRIDQQIGLEDTPEAYVQRLVDVFREVRRILRKDGTLWLNLGDSYMGGGGGNYNKTGISQAGGQHITNVRNKRSVIEASGLKPKDLIGIPWRVAFALQADGWWLRQDIIWHKPNPMPESVTDRCTKSHEYIFLLTKSERYYYDAEAVKEKVENLGTPRKFRDAKENSDGTLRNDNGRMYIPLEYRNKRSVWTVATKPYADAHFAVFPSKLIEPCVLAGCPKDGTVFDPFTGSGTTAQVALAFGRRFIGTELNPEYVELIHKRLSKMMIAMELN